MKTKLVRDPVTGRIIAVPADKVLVGPIEPGMGRTTSSGMRPMTGSSAMAALYARLPDADLAGAAGPGVVPGGEQGKGARRGQIEQDGQPPPPHTYRPLGGARQNARGNTHEVTVVPGVAGGVTFQETPVIIQTPRDTGDDAESIMVALGWQIANPDEFDPIVQAWEILATAVIKWGIGGAFFEARVDWIQGTIFCIPASSVSIHAEVEAQRVVFTDVPVRVLLSAGLAYGTPGSARLASPARRTIPIGNLGAGVTSSVFLIPEWANSVTLVANSATPNLQINLATKIPTLAADGLIYQVVDATNLSLHTEHQFPVPNGFRYFTVTNIGLGITSGIRAIFNLSI